ncbi:secreted frizzled-related protein 4-like isoform X3 [Scyliorhinus canicula]|nr:secreted frizzled-related protein 4-like isoform X3 [Scyliorhinus canicula]
MRFKIRLTICRNSIKIKLTICRNSIKIRLTICRNSIKIRLAIYRNSIKIRKKKRRRHRAKTTEKRMIVSPEPKVQNQRSNGVFLHRDAEWINFTGDVTVPEAACGSWKTDRCKCRKIKPTLKTYLEKNYNYVIRAKVKDVNRRGCNKITTVVEVVEIFKSVAPILQAQITLLTNSSCSCPQLPLNQDLLIMCYVLRSRLMLFNGCLAEKWRDHWVKRFKRWEQRLDKQQQVRIVQERNENARRSERSGGPKSNSKNANHAPDNPRKINKTKGKKGAKKT